MSDTQSNSTAAGAPQSVIFTEKAAIQVRKLLEQEKNAGHSLRVYIMGGGCSGFQYGFKFDDQVAEDDTQIENAGVTLVIDPMSIQYLLGSTLDYKEDIMGSQFVIENPNAKTTCGCGSSFSM